MKLKLANPERLCALLSQVDSLRQEIAGVQAEVDKLERLLKAADPDGFYREGTHAARVAREKGLRLFYQDRERQAALERKKRQQEASSLPTFYLLRKN